MFPRNLKQLETKYPVKKGTNRTKEKKAKSNREYIYAGILYRLAMEINAMVTNQTSRLAELIKKRHQEYSDLFKAKIGILGREHQSTILIL